MSKIFYYSIEKCENKADFFKVVKKTLEKSNWEKYVKGKKIFLKVNALSHQVVPGQNTSPWVLEGVLRLLKDKDVYVGDCDVATIKQLEKAGKRWRYKEICKKYNAKFINLSKQETVKVKVNGIFIDEIELPKILTEVDSIITLPVLKTHNVAGMTCALKNQWGCIPRFRHNYHMHVNEVIADINKAVKVDFCLVDATVCSEGSGPRTGKPKILNKIIGGNDLVSMDKFASDLIGVDNVKYIYNSEVLGIGEIKYDVVGDKVEKCKFEPGIAKNHPIVFLELKLRKIPILNYLIFKTPFFKIPAFLASRYNSVVWHNLHGKKYAKEVLKNKFYREEFKELI